MAILKKIDNRWLIPLRILLYGSLLTACSGLQQTERLSTQISADQQKAERLLQGLQIPRRQRITLHKGAWVSPKAIALPTERLPGRLNPTVTFATGAPLPLSELSKLIRRLYGLSLQLTPDAEIKLREQLDHRSPAGAEPILTEIRWQGKLEGLFDEVAASLGLSWRCQHTTVTFYYLDSRTFQIYAFPSSTGMESTVHSGIDAGSSSGQGSGSGQSSQKTTISLKSDMIKDIYQNIQLMLTDKVGKLSRSPSTGSVTVTDTPRVLDRIAHYIAHENATITKQVLLNIKVLAIELSDKHQLGIDWKLIYKLRGAGSPLVDGLQFAPEGSTAGCSTVIFKMLGSAANADDQYFLFKALAEQGKVSVITSPSVTTLNLQPVPVQVATHEGYLARTEITQQARGDNSTIKLVPGMITHGFNMHLVPFIIANNHLLLQYTINLSELISTKKFGVENKAQIQLPEISSRLFSQKVKLQSGDTLVLSGFEQIRNETKRHGFGTHNNWLMGGKSNADQRRTIIVLVITPVIMA